MKIDNIREGLHHLIQHKHTVGIIGDPLGCLEGVWLGDEVGLVVGDDVPAGVTVNVALDTTTE